MGLRGPLRRPDSRRGLAEIRKREREGEYAALDVPVRRKTETLKQRVRDRRAEQLRQFERAGQDAAALEKFKATNRRLHLAKKYGMSLSDYDRLLFLHGGQCAICRKRDKLCVDHCHSTGAIRGLLCHHCNTALGHFGDSTEALRSAIDYLTRASRGANYGTTWAA